MTVYNLWQDCLKNIKNLIPLKDFVAWISVLTVADESTVQHLTLVAHNSLVYSFVKKKFWKLIEQEFKIISPSCKVIITLQENKRDTNVNVKGHISKLKKKTVRSNIYYQDTRLSGEYKFANLVCGKANHVAYSLGAHIVKDLGNKNHNPFFVYGKVGLGKTHLMQAIGNQIFENNYGLMIRYLHINEYMQDIAQAAIERSFHNLHKYYANLDVLLIDDIQFLSGTNKQKSQEEFVQIINYFLDNNKQIIVTADINPQNIDNMNSRMLSRLNSGVAIEIKPPDINMRLDILKSKISSHNIIVNEDALFFIAQSVQSNVRELEGALNKVLYHAKFSRCAVTLPLVQEALSDYLKVDKSQGVTVLDIQQLIADYFNIQISDLLSDSRSKKFSIPRQYAMSLAKEFTTASLPVIGSAFGGRNHTTVLYAYRKIAKLRNSDPQHDDTYKKLINMLLL